MLCSFGIVIFRHTFFKLNSAFSWVFLFHSGESRRNEGPSLVTPRSFQGDLVIIGGLTKVRQADSLLPSDLITMRDSDDMVLNVSLWLGKGVNIFSFLTLFNQTGKVLAQLKSLQQHVKVTARENAIIRNVSVVSMRLHQQADLLKQCTQYFQINTKCVWVAFVSLLCVQGKLKLRIWPEFGIEWSSQLSKSSFSWHESIY